MSQLPAIHMFTVYFINMSLNIIVPFDLGLIPCGLETKIPYIYPISYLFMHCKTYWLLTSVALPETRSGCLFYRHFSLFRGKKLQADSW